MERDWAAPFRQRFLSGTDAVPKSWFAMEFVAGVDPMIE